MEEVYREMETPVKYGMILSEEGVNIDCPNVIRMPDGTWRMVYARHVPDVPETGTKPGWPGVRTFCTGRRRDGFSPRRRRAGTAPRRTEVSAF